MAVTKERFDQGLTYDAYKAQMTRSQERLESNERTVELSGDDLAFFAQLPAPLHVLALAEDWCGDVIANLPMLGRLAAESGKLNLRVFLRDQNLDLMDQYLNQGQHRSIPVFVFFDEDFSQLGVLIERPGAGRPSAPRSGTSSSPTTRASARPTPRSTNCRRRSRSRHGVVGAIREENRVFADREVVRELRAVVEQGVVRARGEGRGAGG